MAKTFFGVMLLVFGAMLLFHVLGLSWIFRVFISLAIVIYGLKKIQRAETSLQKGLGIGLLLLGFLLFFGGFHVLIGLSFGSLLIYVGIKILKRNEKEDKLTFQGNVLVQEDVFDIEWNKKMKKM